MELDEGTLLRSGDLQTVLSRALPARYPRGLPAPETFELAVAPEAHVRLHVTPRGGRAPLLLLVHGFTGHAGSPCILWTLAHAFARGWSVARIDLRNAGGSHGRTRGLFNLQQWTDLGAALRSLEGRFAPSALAAAGFSLGGTFLLNLVGRSGTWDDRLRGVVAVNPPVDIPRAVAAVGRPRNRLYAKAFLARLYRDLREKRRVGQPYPEPERAPARSVPEYDRRFVLPETPFRSVEEYYAATSALPHLGHIRVPTALLSSRDDPLVPDDTIRAAAGHGPQLAVRRSRYGGHVGYLDRRRLRFAAADALLGFLERPLDA